MKAYILLAATVCLSSVATLAGAEAYCPQMLTPERLEHRYQRIAPIYNEADTGWIFGSDQFNNRYILNSGEEALLRQLVLELSALGTDLAILIAPPRPTVAGQVIVDATTGRPGLYDVVQQGDAFHRMIEQMSGAGAHVPNLLELVETDPEVRRAYYFQRDTHWTNLGAAHSAIALAATITPDAAPAFSVRDLPVLEMTSERGSLSSIVEATCGHRPRGEQSPLLDYTGHLTTAVGLLDDSGADQISAVLLGTSFSDRYRRDQYQTAEALSAALGQAVENRSVSGGGMIGPFETYFLSGQFMVDRPNMIIWEFPYTYQMNEAALRQLLGAVRAAQVEPTNTPLALIDNEATFQVSGGAPVTDLIGVRVDGAEIRDIVVRVVSGDGDETTTRMRRKSRMDEVAILADWWVDLSGVVFDIHSVVFEFRSDARPTRIEALLSTTSG